MPNHPLRTFFKTIGSYLRPKDHVTLTDAQVDTLIDQVYALVLGRTPDATGRKDYLQKILDKKLPIDGLIPTLQASEEYRQRALGWQAHGDPEISRFLTPNVQSFSQRLMAHDHLSKKDFEQIWDHVFSGDRQLVIGQQEYALPHKKRFWELFNAVALLIDDIPHPRLLEFGVSEYSRFYKSLFPDLILDTADRPVDPDYIGFTPSRCKQISGCENHFSVDLTQPHTLAATITNGYDVIVFAEVLEHLVVNPVELFSNLLGLLRPHGTIYLTTPNFFSRKHLEQIRNQENPQEVFPPTNGNWDAHYHHREYGIKELVRFVDQAGGRTTGWYFSDCWDHTGPLATTPDSLPASQRGNIVMTFTRKKT